MIRKMLRRDWLCDDERVRGGCSAEHGPEGSCAACPLHRLDEAMASPAGAVADRAFRLMRRKNVGFPLPAAETLPADLVAAVEILAEEQQGYLDERRQRDEEAESVRRELGKVSHG